MQSFTTEDLPTQKQWEAFQAHVDGWKSARSNNTSWINTDFVFQDHEKAIMCILNVAALRKNKTLSELVFDLDSVSQSKLKSFKDIQNVLYLAAFGVTSQMDKPRPRIDNTLLELLNREDHPLTSASPQKELVPSYLEERTLESTHL